MRLINALNSMVLSDLDTDGDAILYAEVYRDAETVQSLIDCGATLETITQCTHLYDDKPVIDLMDAKLYQELFNNNACAFALKVERGVWKYDIAELLNTMEIDSINFNEKGINQILFTYNEENAEKLQNILPKNDYDKCIIFLKVLYDSKMYFDITRSDMFWTHDIELVIDWEGSRWQYNN